MIEILEIFKESFALIRDLDLAFRWVGAHSRPIPPVMTTPIGFQHAGPVLYRPLQRTHKVSHVQVAASASPGTSVWLCGQWGPQEGAASIGSPMHSIAPDVPHSPL